MIERTLMSYSAICLSTLHYPSPIKPAKLPLLSPTNTNSTAYDKSISESELSNSIEEKESKEILKLNACAHEFHAECLVSWFVIQKYSCPICRSVYYVSNTGEEVEMSGSPGLGGARQRGEV